MLEINSAKTPEQIYSITSKYNLNVGEIGERRLNVLNNLYNGSSQKFLQDLGINNSKLILDVACGTGEMTCWMAKQNTTAQVIGVDISEDQINVAKKNANINKINNIEFICLSAEQLHQINQKFDTIYCRFLLVHVREPEKILSAIYSVLAERGSLICEEGTTSASFCYPHSPTFNRWLKLWNSIRADFDIGIKLESYFRALGLHDIQSRLHQPVLHTEENRSILYYNVVESTAAAQRLGFANIEEMRIFSEEMKEFCINKEYFIGYLRNSLVCGRKNS